MVQYLFWIAYYDDGTCLPQYDPDTGEENLFSQVDFSRLVKFGWYPFTQVLATKLKDQVLCLPLRSYEVELKNGEKVIAKREGRIESFTYHKCTNCGMEWRARLGDEAHTDKMEHGSRVVEYSSYICKRCGSYNDFVCHDCNRVISKDSGGRLFCDRCNKTITHPIQRMRGENRELVYCLGIEGSGYITIDKSGNVKFHSSGVENGLLERSKSSSLCTPL